MTSSEHMALPVQFEHVAIGSETRSCQDHGDYVATRWELQPTSPIAPPFWSKCPTCDSEVQRALDARGGAAEKQRAAAMRLQAAGIPQRYLDSTIWNWVHPMDQQEHVWHWARTYCTHFQTALQSGRSGVLLGGTGTGKTHLAIGILRHVIEKGGTGLYVTVMGMLGRIKDTYNAHANETEQKVIDELASVDLLVIDEVGRQLDTNYESAQFFRVLDMRYRSCKPTILVSNLNKAKLTEFLGEAMVDRLREGGGALLVFDWASQRSARKQQEVAAP